jgi:phosphoenolpyruvate carboxylase
VDPLSLIQISLMRRKREMETKHTDHQQVDAVLATRLSGIAPGLRNTG